MANEADNNNTPEENGPKEFKQPAWFTPERLLIILCVINLINYVDRGAIASNGVNGFQGNSTCRKDEACFQGTGIVGDFSLSYFQDGILASAFMVGLLIASPIFADLSKTFNPMRLIGVGLSVWTIATAGCGLSVDFWSIACFRMLVGVAEASFISLAAPFIDDYAPPEKRTAWLSLFYACIPVGVALGYVYGGIVGGMWGWRMAFWVESLAMLPFAVFGFLSSPVHLKQHQYHDPSKSSDEHHPDHSTALLKDAGDSSTEEFGGRRGGAWSSRPVEYMRILYSQGADFLEDIKKLLAEKVYVIDVVGYIAYNFVIGAYAYWGPKVGHALYGIDNADVVFGVVTIFSGILGTLFGGFALDHIGSTIPTAFKFLSIVTCIGGVMCFLAFLATDLLWFIPLFAIGEFSIFATQGPVNFVTLHSVPPNMRPIAIAISTVSIHIFGDVPSSPIVGVVQDYVQNWRISALLLTTFLFLASAIWACGTLLKIPAGEVLPSDEEKRDLAEEEAVAVLLGAGP
ncbi:unnamed protein product [Calypogeia fissa]